jgi:hypothetical protein
MDPYLEDPVIWPDFHTTLIVAMRAELNSVLPEGYLAVTDRHVWIEGPKGKKRRPREPDVFVARAGRRSERQEAPAAVAAPRHITLPLRERKGRPYLKITDGRDRRVVTVVELLCPSNKTPGEDYEQYLAKREEYLASGVNLVEVNLLRAGRLPPLGEAAVELQYYILVCRADELPDAAIWPFTVRDPFPDFSIPLRKGNQVAFNLRAGMDRAYGEAKYEQEINYGRPPVPPFDENDAGWVRAVSRKASK